MHMVEPRGSTKPAILGGIPSSSSATAMLVGSVALLELVENAVTMLARMRLQNTTGRSRSEEHTSELQSQSNLVCRLLLEKKKIIRRYLQDSLRSDLLAGQH